MSSISAYTNQSYEQQQCLYSTLDDYVVNRVAGGALNRMITTKTLHAYHVRP